MRFYEFNDYSYYALIGTNTVEEALEEYRDKVADMELDEKDLKPDILTEEKARKRYCECLIAQGEEDKKYEEFEKEFARLMEEEQTHVFLVDYSLI